MICEKGMRLTRRPCKGNKFEIEIFEARKQNVGIFGVCQILCVIWTLISSPARCINFVLRVQEKDKGFMIFKSSKDHCQNVFGKVVAAD